MTPLSARHAHTRASGAPADAAAGALAADAEAFLAERAAAAACRRAKSIVAETLAVLRDPTFAPLFGPESRAEVPIVADTRSAGAWTGAAA